jgi:hypothetical protein
LDDERFTCEADVIAHLRPALQAGADEIGEGSFTVRLGYREAA